MWKMLNLKWDYRTLRNILMLPVILFIRVPVLLFFWGIEWINDWSEVVNDILPAWKSR